MKPLFRPAACTLPVLALSILLAATPALAQQDTAAENATADPTGPDTAPDAPIVVTGYGLEDGPGKIAYDTTVIDGQDLERSASGRIEDALASVAGFQQFRRADSRASNPSNQGVTLRALGGNASSRALVLLDGVPVANPFFGYIPLSALAPDRLGGIRVTRGGGMGAFGTGAVSGTIELFSANPKDLGAIDDGALKASALVDQRGETQGSVTVGQSLGEGFVVAGAQWDRGQGFWTTPKDQRVAASARAAYESWSASVRAVAPLTETVEVQAAGLAYDDARTLRFKGANSTSTGQQASLRLVGKGDWQFDALAYVQAQDFSNIVISATSFKKTLDQKKTPTLAGGGKLELRPPVGDDHVLRLGADLRLASGNLVELPYSAVTGRATALRRAGGKQSDLGLYVEDDWRLGDFDLTAGIRADRWTIRDGFFTERSAAGVLTQDTRFANRDGWDTNARAAARWSVVDGTLYLRTAAYTGLRLPTLNELYRPFVVFPVTTRANDALKPERLRGVEAGIDWHPGPSKLSLTVFDNRLADAVANVTVAPNVRQRQNVKAIRARGIEATGEIKLGRINLSGSLAWTESKVEAVGVQSQLDGLRPAQVPKLSASGTVSWTFGSTRELAATVRHTGAQFEDDLQTDILPAATTVDLYATVALVGPVSLVLRAENVTDVAVVTRNQGGSIDLGAPRTLWAGLRVGLR